MKASINGPNRRKNRRGNQTVASDFSNSKKNNNISSADGVYTDNGEQRPLKFKVKSLETLLNNVNDTYTSFLPISKDYLGDACVFIIGASTESNQIDGKNSCSGQELIQQHFQMIASCSPADTTKNSTYSMIDVTASDPILIHFHEIPILILRAIPTLITIEDDQLHKECNIIYLSQVHCHNHKICVDTTYTISCCSRIKIDERNNSQRFSLRSKESLIKYKNYDNLLAIGIEVFLRYSNSVGIANDDDPISTEKKEEYEAKDIAKLLINHCLHSVLTVNECVVIEIKGEELVCRVSKVAIDTKSIIEDSDESDYCEHRFTAAEASLDEPFRGRVTINTDFYIETSNQDAIQINGGRFLSDVSLPEDVIHVTTSDDEWFPVRRILLAPCINLTKYVQHGKGIYKQSIDQKERIVSRCEDAPKSGIHCSVNIDCCTFDRVLLFIMSQLYPDEYQFSLALSEINALSHAAQELGLISLSDLCRSQMSSFESRVRKDKYIRFSEIEKRNSNNELLIIIDGMVLDITRWIDEHPGGPSIIPSQALNIDCTCFFEMYHVSSASFLYLRSFYIGELHPGTELKKSDIKPSDGFLQSLRSYTEQWRVNVEEKVGEIIHKSL